jgi:hypothetical protein
VDLAVGLAPARARTVLLASEIALARDVMRPTGIHAAAAITIRRRSDFMLGSLSLLLPPRASAPSLAPNSTVFPVPSPSQPRK